MVIDYELVWDVDLGAFVPIIIIFGSTSSGQQACAHIHGVFPYLFVRPVDMYDRNFADAKDVER
jgi:hypothetical protein